MTNGGAVCWLKAIKKELSIQPRESKRIAIDKAISALKENELLEKDAEHYRKIAINRTNETKELQALNRELVHLVKFLVDEWDIGLNEWQRKLLEKAEGVENNV